MLVLVRIPRWQMHLVRSTPCFFGDLEEVRRLGACWDAIRSRYYVPAGVGLVAFEGWRERPPKS